nr:unnamed protein product [Callosobruchus chinensis]
MSMVRKQWTKENQRPR